MPSWLRTLARATLVLAYAFFARALPAATWSALNAGLPARPSQVASITISPTQPSTLYARTVGSDGTSGVFKSTNGAATWNVLSSLSGSVAALAVDPQDPATIYAAAGGGTYPDNGGGILKSRDGGKTWTTGDASLLPTFIDILAVDSASNLYLASGGRVFKSSDGGATSQVLDLGLPSNSTITSLVMDPADPSRLYALCPIFQDHGPFQATIVRSTDSGQTWNPVFNGLISGGSVTSLVISATAPSLLFAILPSVPSGTPIFKSSDGGDTWAPVNTGLPTGAYVTSLAIDPSNSSRIYLAVTSDHADIGGILQSDDGGATCTHIQPNLPANTALYSLTIDPYSPFTFYAVANNTVLKSTDGGFTWRGAADGPSTLDVSVLAASPLDAFTVYASSLNGLFKSGDGGASWNNLGAFQLFTLSASPPDASPYPDGSPAYPQSLLIDFSNPDNLYLSTNRSNGCYFADNLLFKSTDGGTSWDTRISPQTSGCVLGGFFGLSGGLKAMDPTDPATFYVAEANDGDGYWQLLRTRDGGATWNNLGDFPGNLQAGVWALAIDPAAPATLYAAIDDYGIHADPASLPSAIGGVYKTTDGGITWNSIGLSGAAVNLLVIAPGGSNVLYAVTEGDYSLPRGFRGLFKSTDSGATWSAMNTGLDNLLATGSNITALAIDPTDANRLYLGVSGGGVFKSADGGAAWMPFNAGLDNLNVRSLAPASGGGHILYAGTSGGVFKIVDDGGAEQ